MEEGEIILDSHDGNKLFTLSLKNMQEAGILCDAIIVCVSDARASCDSLLAHACVLAASSPTLKTLLLEQTISTEKGLKQVDSMGFNEATWNILLEFMYTSRVVLQAEQRDVLKDVESAAKMLQVSGLCNAIERLTGTGAKKKAKEKVAPIVKEKDSDAPTVEKQPSLSGDQEMSITSAKRSRRLAIKREKRKFGEDDQSKGLRTVQIKLERLDEEDIKSYWSPDKKRITDNDDYNYADSATEENELQCSICSGSFTGKRLLNRHIKLFHPQLKSHYCNVCGAQFNTKIVLEDHHRREHKAKLLDCLVCYKKFITKDAWRRHTRLYHPDMYRAVKERAVDLDEKALKSDLSVELHGLDESSLQPIDSISEFADTAEIDIDEIGMEAKEPTISDGGGDDDDDADEDYDDNGDDDNVDDDDDDDINADDDDEEVTETITFEEATSMSGLFNCKECEFVAESRTDLIEHMMVHADTKPYCCSLCPKAFKSQPGLYAHRKRRHPDKFQGRHACTECTRTFGNKGEVEDHKRLNHDAEPLSCERCAHTFRTRDALYRHERFKHNLLSRREIKRQQTFLCNDCNIEYRYSFQLEDHMRKKHNAPPLVCEECGIGVMTRDALYRHRRYVHTADENRDQSQNDNLATADEIKAHKEAVEWNSQHSKFKCPVCNYCAMSRFTLREHMKKHSDQKHYHCQLCSKDFKYKVGMYNHQLRHHPELVPKQFKCSLCSKVFGREVHLQDHIRISHGGDLLKCEICSKQYRTNDAMYRHKRYKHPNKFRKRLKLLKKCDKCGYTTLSNAAFQMHLLTHTNVRAFVCEICGADFKYKGDLSKHTKTTHMPDYKPKTYMCETCGAHCRNKKILKRHYISRHQKEFQRTFQCTLCSQEFGSKTTRADHMRYLHEGKAIICEFCNVTLVDPDEWYKHKQAEHADMVTRVHSGMFSCNLCNKLFKKVALLRRHERYHVTVRPYVCTVCQQSFVAKEDLVTHHKIHSGAKPYSCPHCSFATLRKPTLTMHMKKHSNQLLQCPKCDKSYLMKISLAKHLRTVHKMDNLNEQTIVMETLKVIEQQENLPGENTIVSQTVDVVEFPNQIQHEIKIEASDDTVGMVETSMDLLPSITEIHAETEEVVEEEDAGGQVIYVVTDDKETTQKFSDGQEVMYIKLSDNQYIQVMNPGSIAHMQ